MIEQKLNVNGSIDDNTILALQEQKIFANLNCIRIGQIEEFDTKTQTATVQLVDKVQLKDKIVNQPLLLDIPCVFLGNSKSYLTIPVAKNDNCLVFINDRDIDNWYITNTLNIPNSTRKHNFSDGFCLVGIRNTLTQLNDFDNSIIEIKNKSSIKIGENITNEANGDFEIQSTGLIQIKNTSQSLFTLLNTLLTTLLNLKAGTIPIDGATAQALTTLQTNLSLLLKA